MSDYISREDIVNRVNDLFWNSNRDYEPHEIILELHDAIADLPAADVRPRWIPVAERLPEETGTYLVWMKWDLTEADEEPSAYPVLYDADEEGFGWWKSYYSGETLGWAGEDFVRYEGITHWMPLPEPPKEG